MLQKPKGPQRGWMLVHRSGVLGPCKQLDRHQRAAPQPVAVSDAQQGMPQGLNSGKHEPCGSGGAECYDGLRVVVMDLEIEREFGACKRQ